MSSAETVVVTGAAGFIGSHLACRLAREGRRVVGIDNFDPYYPRVEKEINAERVREAGGELREVDILDRGSLDATVGDVAPEVIVHLAGKAGVRDSVRLPLAYVETNVNGTQNVLEACRRFDVERMILASTSSVYGHAKRTPFVESDPCDAPLHPYAASKRSAELLTSTYAHLYGLQATVFRFFTVYGPHGRPDMMPRLLLDNVTTGAPVSVFEGDLARDWTHVDDVAAGLALAVDTPVGFEIINLGRGAPLRLADFIATLESVSGRPTRLTSAPRPASEMLTTHAATDKLRRLFGFTPSVSVGAGVESLWEWWEQYGRGGARPAVAGAASGG